MFSKVDKAWVSALVTFIGLTVMTFFGIELDGEVQTIIVGAIWTAVQWVATWAVPNKPDNGFVSMNLRR